MKKSYYSLSGYGLFILPPWPVRMKVDEIRKECCELFGLKKTMIPPVHISLANLFDYNEVFQTQLIKNIRAHTRSISPFEQHIVNFGSFKSHTVFVKATQNPGIAELNYVSNYVSGNKNRKYDYAGKYSSFQPHLSIAYRDLTKDLYPSVWEEYKDRNYEASFEVKNFTLVKWDALSFEWKKIHDFPLEASKPFTLFDSN